MASLSDHVRRDAEHAARSEIRVQISRFVRRMDEAAKAEIKAALEAAALDGREVDGLAIGREAAAHAIASYIDPGEPQPAIDAPEAEERPAGELESPRL
jgi:hypothetical protein